MHNMDLQLQELREISFVMFSECNYIDDTDECVDNQSPQLEKEPLSNY